jgi:Flp pilus assembly protein protease CpaA
MPTSALSAYLTCDALAFASPALVSARPAAPPVHAWVWMLLALAGLVASVTDLREMRIPNWLTMPLLAGGLVYGGVQSGLGGLGGSVLGAVAAGAIFVAAYAMAGGGAGDAKLMLALGSWLGLEPAVVLVLAVTVAGFVWGMAVTAYRDGISTIPMVILHGLVSVRLGASRLLSAALGGSRRSSSPEASAAKAAVRERPKQWFPYAPAIFVGTLGAWWYWERFGAIM